MAKAVIDVTCPCCKASLKVESATGNVLSHKEPERPKPIEDLAAEAAKLKGEAARREEVFQKSFQNEKARQTSMSQKFDELFKAAKDDPDQGPPRKPFDLD
jgi:hypothetical protein